MRVAKNGLQPNFKGAGALAVGRHFEEVSAAVCGNAHALLRLGNAEELLAQLVILVDVVDVAIAVSLGELLEQFPVVPADGEIDVARANGHNLDDSLRALAEWRVEEEGVDFAVMQRLHRSGARGELDVGRRQVRVLEVADAVVVAYLPLRDWRVAHAHPRPVGDLRGHQLHRAGWRRVEGEVHPAKRLEGEDEVLEDVLGAEGRADDIDLREVHEVVFAEWDAFGLDAGGGEDILHYSHADVVVGRGPEVHVGVSLAVCDPYRRGVGGRREGGGDCE